MSNDKSKFYDKDPNRDEANRGRICGGNSASQEVNVESHESKRATRIPQGGGGGQQQGSTTGTNRSWHNERLEGGNSFASPSQEKHDQPKNKGKHYVGGKLVGPAATDLMPAQVDDRGLDSSGNCSNGGTEKQGQKKAQRLDMSVERFHR
jgi:hypothetical protein